MAEQGTVGHGVTDKSKCCTCTAKWASWHDDESHNMWGAVMPLVIINVRGLQAINSPRFM